VEGIVRFARLGLMVPVLQVREFAELNAYLVAGIICSQSIHVCLAMHTGVRIGSRAKLRACWSRVWQGRGDIISPMG
jgi:hypothetical protein